jgi:hypothetical protein
MVLKLITMCICISCQDNVRAAQHFSGAQYHTHLEGGVGSMHVFDTRTSADQREQRNTHQSSAMYDCLIMVLPVCLCHGALLCRVFGHQM